jgi:hypothetical protein
MKTVAFVLLGLFVVSLGLRLVLFLVARGMGGFVARAIGRAALDCQPDEIHLDDCGAGAWRHFETAHDLVDSFKRAGFSDAGTYRIREMPVVLQLLVHESESLYGVVYEHPQSGHWIDVVARFADGTASTWTTAPDTGLDARPGFPMIHAPGTLPSALVARARSELRAAPLAAATRASVAGDFESAYADSMAWRKGRGVTAGEVGRIASKKAA